MADMKTPEDLLLEALGQEATETPRERYVRLLRFAKDVVDEAFGTIGDPMVYMSGLDLVMSHVFSYDPEPRPATAPVQAKPVTCPYSESPVLEGKEWKIACSVIGDNCPNIGAAVGSSTGFLGLFTNSFKSCKHYVLKELASGQD